MDKVIQTKFITTDIVPYYIYMTKNCITPICNRGKHAFGINLNGYSKLTFFDGTVMESKPGDFSYLPQGASYNIEVIEPYDSFNVAFSLVNDNIDLAPFLFNVKNDPVLIERFKKINNIWMNKKTGFEEKALVEFYNIVYAMKQHHFANYLPSSKYNILLPALEFIHANYRFKKISVEELANMCGISYEYFRIIFKNLTGNSPLEYIQNLQITSAKELLDCNEYSISEISEKLGFSEISKFSRKFKSLTGMSPSEYLNNKK